MKQVETSKTTFRRIPAKHMTSTDLAISASLFHSAFWFNQWELAKGLSFLFGLFSVLGFNFPFTFTSGLHHFFSFNLMFTEGPHIKLWGFSKVPQVSTTEFLPCAQGWWGSAFSHWLPWGKGDPIFQHNLEIVVLCEGSWLLNTKLIKPKPPYESKILICKLELYWGLDLAASG